MAEISKVYRDAPVSNKQDDVSLTAALVIEDLFCKAFVGGRTQRLAAIQISVSNAIDLMRKHDAARSIETV